MYSVGEGEMWKDNCVLVGDVEGEGRHASNGARAMALVSWVAILGVGYTGTRKYRDARASIGLRVGEMGYVVCCY